MKNLKFHLTCFRGLEQVLINEIKHFNIFNINQIPGIVICECSFSEILKIAYFSRIINKIQYEIFSSKIYDVEDIYNNGQKILWEKFTDINSSFLINCGIYNNKFIKHSGFAALKLKDSIVDYFRKKFNKRPDVDKNNPDTVFDLKIIENQMHIFKNLSNQPLYKRGYRAEAGDAPVKETLAGGIAELIYDKKFKKIIDPMCGSGTLIIETAMKYLKIFPADIQDNPLNKILKTNNFKFPAYKNENSEIPEFFGCDIDIDNVKNSRKNAEKAGLKSDIRFVKQDFFNPLIDMTDSLIIFNPPYGKRINNIENIDEFYKKIGDTMKKYCKGSTVYILTNYDNHIKKIGLRSSQKNILFNGKIECRLLKYEIF